MIMNPCADTFMDFELPMKEYNESLTISTAVRCTLHFPAWEILRLSHIKQMIVSFKIC